MKRIHTKLIRIFIVSALLTSSASYAESTIPTPNDVIGFYQTKASEYAFSKDLAESGYTTLIDAFWVNYPWCWKAGTQHSKVPECVDLYNKGIWDVPAPVTKPTTWDKAFWNSNWEASGIPTNPGSEYNNYFWSLHNNGLKSVISLRKQIYDIGTNDLPKKKIKLLASIGGWNMGGSSAGSPSMPSSGNPAWKELLNNPESMAKLMEDIMNIKVTVNAQGKKVPLYDGIDIDIETPYGMGCAEGNKDCTAADRELAVDNLSKAIIRFHQLKPHAILSASPRSVDVYCPQNECSWNEANGTGFFGEVLKKLADHQVYLNDLNLQFYNDNNVRNIPNNQIGKPLRVDMKAVNEILTGINNMGIIKNHYTNLNIGVLAQTIDGQRDTGITPSPTNPNPGLPKSRVQELWNYLQKNSTIQISGLMNWASNIDMGAPQKIRPVTVSPDSKSYVPYNWGSSLWQSKPSKPTISWASAGLPSTATTTGGQFNPNASLLDCPTGDHINYTCSLQKNNTLKTIKCTIKDNGDFELPKSDGVSLGDKIIIIANDSLNKATSIQSKPIIVSKPSSKKTVTISNNQPLSGSYYYISPNRSNDVALGSIGRQSIQLNNINLEKNSIIIRPWDEGNRGDEYDVICPKPKTFSQKIHYRISGTLKRVECNIIA